MAVLKKIVSAAAGYGWSALPVSGLPGFDYRYHSCNDRHCPQCGQTDAMLAQTPASTMLLPTPCFLLTFTVPKRCGGLSVLTNRLPGPALCLQRPGRAGTGAQPSPTGADLGMLGVLHTWSRTLIFHPHIHYLCRRRLEPGRTNLDRRQPQVPPAGHTAGRSLPDAVQDPASNSTPNSSPCSVKVWQPIGTWTAAQRFG